MTKINVIDFCQPINRHKFGKPNLRFGTSLNPELVEGSEKLDFSATLGMTINCNLRGEFIVYDTTMENMF